VTKILTQRNTVILAGGEELANPNNIRLLEDAGYLVVTANNLDYALAANELFKPKILILDADGISGDIGFFCLTLINRLKPPCIYILGRDEKARIDEPLLEGHIEYLGKPLLMPTLIKRIES